MLWATPYFVGHFRKTGASRSGKLNQPAGESPVLAYRKVAHLLVNYLIKYDPIKVCGMKKFTIYPHCGGRYQYDEKNEAGVCDVYCRKEVEEGKWEVVEKAENESEDIKAFRKEIEIELLKVINNYRQDWEKKLTKKIKEKTKLKEYPDWEKSEFEKGYNQALNDILELLKNY